MGRPDFDASTSDSFDGGDIGGTSLDNAYFGAATSATSNISSVNEADQTSVGSVFGTRMENSNGTP